MCFCSYPCVQDDDDLVYEEDVNRNPYIMKGWIRYLDYKKEAPNYVRNILYERALRELPGSYKIWIAYLKERKLQVRGRPITDPSYEAVNKCFERCLVYLHKVIQLHHSVLSHLLSSFIAAFCFLFDYCTLILTIFFFFFVPQMPRIWLEYGEFLIEQKKITRTRKVFDRALRSLAYGQHDRIWKLYVKFVRTVSVPIQTAVRVFRRYLKVHPLIVHPFIDSNTISKP